MKKCLLVLGAALALASCRKEYPYPGIQTRVAVSENATVHDGTIKTPATNVRIGSFLASNADTKSVTLARAEVTIAFAGEIANAAVQNVRLEVSGNASYARTIPQASAHNAYSLPPLVCPANGLLTFEVFADIPATTGSLQSAIRIFDGSGTPLTSAPVLGQTITLVK